MKNINKSQLSTIEIPFVAIVFLTLTACASRPLAVPPLPAVDLVNAHVGVIAIPDGENEIASWHGWEIGEDIAGLALDLARNTFTQASVITETNPPPDEIDLLLEIVNVEISGRSPTLTWNDSTSTIRVAWQLSERDGVEIVSRTFRGEATNRAGPKWNTLEKRNERIAIALRQILARSMATLQVPEAQREVQVALERVDEIRQDEAEARAEPERLEASRARAEQERAEILASQSPVEDFTECIHTTVDALLEPIDHPIADYDLRFSASNVRFEGFVIYTSGAKISTAPDAVADAIHFFTQLLTDRTRNLEYADVRRALENACVLSP